MLPNINEEVCLSAPVLREIVEEPEKTSFRESINHLIEPCRTRFENSPTIHNPNNPTTLEPRSTIVVSVPIERLS